MKLSLAGAVPLAIVPASAGMETPLYVLLMTTAFAAAGAVTL